MYHPTTNSGVGPAKQNPDTAAFQSGLLNEAKRYTVQEVIGKGSYGVVCSAIDNTTGQQVAIKKIQNVFENVADATRILREIKLLRLLKHPDVVEIKHILLPSDPRTFRDLYVVFELMESDLHTVIAANDDLTQDHHKVFLYQLLRGLNFMHQSGVLHRDLKPKNVLANSNCKLKICDFGLARPYTNQQPMSPVYWTDYVATRWYRAPELCGCFYGRYTQAVDMWSAGCIFAEVLSRTPVFPGRDAVSQLQIITDLLGKPAQHVIDSISNQRARTFLSALPPKPGRRFEDKFPGTDPMCLDLLHKMLSFDPSERPTASEALAHPYFSGLPSAVAQEAVNVSPHFEFEAHKLNEADVRQLIYVEVLHYHPQAQAAYLTQQKKQATALASLHVRSMAAAAAVHPRASPYAALQTLPVEDVHLQFMLAEQYSNAGSVGGSGLGSAGANAAGLLAGQQGTTTSASLHTLFAGMTTWQRSQAEALLQDALLQMQAAQQAQAQALYAAAAASAMPPPGFGMQAAAAQQAAAELACSSSAGLPSSMSSGLHVGQQYADTALVQQQQQYRQQLLAAAAAAAHHVEAQAAVPYCAPMADGAAMGLGRSVHRATSLHAMPICATGC